MNCPHKVVIAKDSIVIAECSKERFHPGPHEGGRWMWYTETHFGYGDNCYECPRCKSS